MQWENDIWCTLRDTAKQSETRWIYDVIQTDQSTWSWENTSWFELVKVISHQSVIIWWFNSTTEFVRIRLRSKWVHCGSSPEKRQWHLQHHPCRVERQQTSRLIFDSFTVEATTTSLGRPTQLWSTSHHTTSCQQWSIWHHSNVGQNSGNSELNARIQSVIDIHWYLIVIIVVIHLFNEQLTINWCN